MSSEKFKMGLYLLVILQYKRLVYVADGSWRPTGCGQGNSATACHQQGHARPFRMRGTRNGQGMLMLNRPLRCPANIGCSCPHQLYVNLIDGTLIGSIVQRPSCSQNVFHLMDAENEPQLVIKGPWLAYHCCLDLAFKQVYSIKGGRSIGRVIRQWREGKDMFHIAFPLDLHVLLKLLLLNAAVLIVSELENRLQ
ncbi:uncharacterized protein DEA37_0004689 [Paragonimus westermani]|uniref:Phospholipid scramblase n=1 Tax=Paragonimus westermani TaxID=34504 RepID=A0A5J4NPH8_9TREM|nr:uncharacterized protein DEA37_0004689 [Paragonimus westermani]